MLPAILRAAGSGLLRGGASATANRLIVSSRLNKIAGNGIVQGIAKHSGASKVPALDKLGSYLSKVKPEKPDPKTKTTSSDKNRDKARTDADRNKERQEKANRDSQRQGDESNSLLRVISKDTVRVRDAVELLVKNMKGGEGSGSGLLGGLLGSLGGLLPKGAAMLGSTVARMGAHAIPALSRMGKSAISAGGRFLGMGKAAAGAASARLFGTGAKAAAPVAEAAATAGRHALRDPKTGRFISRAASAGLTAASIAPKGILGTAGEAASKGAGMFGRIAGKGGGILGKGIAKAAGKSLIKKIPIIGAIAGLGFAANRALAGDWTGAGLEAASGIAGTIPGIGTAASLGLDAAILARDLKNDSSRSGSTVPKPATPTTATRKPVPVAAAATPAVATRRTAVHTESMQVILGKMLDLMSDSTKGIYTVTANRSTSVLAPPRAEGSPQPKADIVSTSPYDRAVGTIGPVTSGNGSVTSGNSMNSGPIPSSTGLGSLSAHYESGRRGSSAVGWDSTGGTSYGKYQIASRTGTLNKFMDYLKVNNPEAYRQLAAAGDPDGGKNGSFAKKWQELAANGTLGNSEHDFIKKSHYDVGFGGIRNEGLRSLIGGSSALQDVLWSTSVQHGGKGSSGIFNKVYREGMSEQDLIRAVYAERGTRFGSSTAKVRASVQNRFVDEQRRALAAVGASPTGMVRDQAVATAGASRAPIVVHAPTTNVQSGQGKATNTPSMASATPVVVRNPDSPVRANVNALISTT